MEQRIALRNEGNQYLIGCGIEEEINLYSVLDLEQIDPFLQKHAGKHIFFVLSYELGLQLLDVPQNTSKKRSDLPLASFWVAKSVCTKTENELRFLEGEPVPEVKAWAETINQTSNLSPQQWNWTFLNSKEQYLKDIAEIQHHMQIGNCYELNYCQKIEADGGLHTDGLELFKQLNFITKAPHSAYLENDRMVLASGSPERFIKKTGNKLSSQPIKGTAPRGKTPEQDDFNKQALLASLKDQTENVMIVDLVRNDCSKIASKGSVQVEELGKLYTFETVHQLISTVSCDLKSGTTFSAIIKALFPMGSMTGAPKKAVVELTENIEKSARDWYSGSIGHISPNGDFDCNVLIRTLFYDKKKETISCMVGGAITHLSDPEEEWEECKTKVGKIIDHFGSCTW